MKQKREIVQKARCCPTDATDAMQSRDVSKSGAVWVPTSQVHGTGAYAVGSGMHVENFPQPVMEQST
jgi:hypothetical protein